MSEYNRGADSVNFRYTAEKCVEPGYCRIDGVENDHLFTIGIVIIFF